MIRFGPAGWSYKDWEGVVYPASKPPGFDQLEYLAAYFDVIEVNSTFYRPASRQTAENWLRRVERHPRFRFSAKLWRRFTHERNTVWTSAEVAEARAAFDPLQAEGRLGAVLLQFPWSYRRTDENREWLDDLTRTFRDFPLVVEVRHASWNDPDFFSGLTDAGIGFVNIDQPLFRDSIAPSARATARVGYIRVHGRNYQDWWRSEQEPHQRYNYLYPARELEPWAARVTEIARDPTTQEIYVITNNHFRGQATTNALMLKSMVEGEVVAAPEPLFAEYAQVLREYARPGRPDA